jgi:hypothetical protein
MVVPASVRGAETATVEMSPAAEVADESSAGSAQPAASVPMNMTAAARSIDEARMSSRYSLVLQRRGRGRQRPLAMVRTA